MKKLLFSVLMASMYIVGVNAQNVITNNYGTPITGADGQSINSGDEGEDESFGYAGLMYYGFDGGENYGIFASSVNPNGVGSDYALRAQFKSHGNVNTEFLINYSFGLWAQDSNRLLFTVALGPSFRCYDKIEGIDKNGKVEYSSGSFACDGIVNPRLTIKFGKLAITGGYYYWAPKFKFSKDDGATGGFNIGLGYVF